MSEEQKVNEFKDEGNMKELEMINQKSELQKRKSAYERKYRRQIKEKLKNVMNQFKRGI